MTKLAYNNTFCYKLLTFLTLGTIIDFEIIQEGGNALLLKKQRKRRRHICLLSARKIEKSIALKIASFLRI